MFHSKFVVQNPPHSFGPGYVHMIARVTFVQSFKIDPREVIPTPSYKLKSIYSVCISKQNTVWYAFLHEKKRVYVFAYSYAFLKEVSIEPMIWAPLAHTDT